MDEARAVKAIMSRFLGAERATDTSRAQLGTVVDPDGKVWALRCRCGNHPHRGHEAKPVARQARPA